MKISKKLEDFIDDFFNWTAIKEPDLQLEKAKYKNKPEYKKRERDRKRRERDRNKSLKCLSDLQKHLDKDQYLTLKAKIEDEYEESKKKLLKDEGGNYLLGKETTGFNNFVYGCYYIFKKQVPGIKDSDIFKWTEEFLKNKDYRMKGGKKYYDSDIIKTRVFKFKKMDQETKQHIEILIERSFQDYIG